MAQTTLVSLFYLVVANAVVFQSLSSKKEVAPSLEPVSGVALKPVVAGAATAKAEPSASASTSDAAPVIIAQADTEPPETSSVPTIDGKPVAGATFTQVFTRAPDVPEHTWCAADHKQFQLRIGPDYKKNGKKASSAVPIYEPCGVDVIW